jgi:hypothetical protein
VCQLQQHRHRRLQFRHGVHSANTRFSSNPFNRSVTSARISPAIGFIGRGELADQGIDRLLPVQSLQHFQRDLVRHQHAFGRQDTQQARASSYFSRTPGANLGCDWRSRVMTVTWRRPAGTRPVECCRCHVSVVERIQLRPEHVALEFQRLQNLLLLIWEPRLALHIVQRKICVPRRLIEALVEIAQRLRIDETVALQHAETRSLMMVGANISVSDDATASSRLFSLTKWR